MTSKNDKNLEGVGCGLGKTRNCHALLADENHALILKLSKPSLCMGLHVMTPTSKYGIPWLGWESGWDTQHVCPVVVVGQLGIATGRGRFSVGWSMCWHLTKGFTFLAIAT